MSHHPFSAAGPGRLLAGCLVALAVSLGGCSLLTIESPAKPLPERDLNARLLTRDYALVFIATVTRAADEIAASSPDRELDTLRWKINASSGIRQAVTHTAPLVALLDVWTFTLQMQDFFVSGAGRELFGEQQSMASDACKELALEIERIATALLKGAELARYRAFAQSYVAANPLADTTFERQSVLAAWTRANATSDSLIRTVGTAPEVMNDIADRMRLYGEQLPSQVGWQAELALRESGYEGADLRAAFESIDRELAALSASVVTAPERLQENIEQIRASLHALADRFDASMQLAMTSLRDERVAIADLVDRERLAFAELVDRQRAALAADAAGIVSDVTERSWRHARGLAREFTFYYLVVLLLLLSLPFVAGFALGRARRGSSSAAS